MNVFSKFILLILSFSLFSNLIHAQDSIPYRKLYLHTDREHYFLGDTLWYKGYYLNGQSHKFVPGLITMYLDLINESGQSVLDRIVPIDHGAADGAIDLHESLEPGNYILRAFTDFQKQVGEDAFFHKQIQISKLESFVEESEKPESSIAQEIDLVFLPEGGMLLEGHKNAIGIKALDSQGRGISLQGEIRDSRGEIVETFTTSFKGMTSIHLLPQSNETYTVELIDYPEYSFLIQDVVKAGIKIEFDKSYASDLHFSAVTSAESLLGRTYYFAISHHGDVLFHQKFVPKEKTFPIVVNKDALSAGINRLVILDEQLLPISERLIFSSNYQINEVKIKADKRAYNTRSSVRLRLTDAKELENQSWSNLSMVVVDEIATGTEDPKSNILSCLLIDSELRGHIESPSEYFMDDPDLASAEKLDLLMMTQGWSRYIWNEPEEYMAFEDSEEEGFCISGTVNRVVGNKTASEGTVDLKIYSNDFMHMDESIIDKEGRFFFKGVSYLDTASVFIQARNKRDKLAYEISLDPFFTGFPQASTRYLPKEKLFVPQKAELYQKQYDNLQALMEYTLSTGGFYLDEVSITESKRDIDDGHFRIYAKPSNSIKLPEKDIGAVSIFDYIRSHFSGVIVTSSNTVLIGGLNSTSGVSLTEGGLVKEKEAISNSGAMLLLDGIQVSSDLLESVSMNQIDVIEILKFPHEYGIFGTRAANGVVAVYSKKGIERINSDKYIPGTIAENLEGYSSSREFYSPKYTPETIHSGKPDHRIVLYWNPNIFTEKGKAVADFFTSDDLSRYKVYVEGITKEGKICLGRGGFEVDVRNEQGTLNID